MKAKNRNPRTQARLAEALPPKTRQRRRPESSHPREFKLEAFLFGILCCWHRFGICSTSQKKAANFGTCFRQATCLMWISSCPELPRPTLFQLLRFMNLQQGCDTRVLRCRRDTKSGGGCTAKPLEVDRALARSGAQSCPRQGARHETAKLTRNHCMLLGFCSPSDPAHAAGGHRCEEWKESAAGLEVKFATRWHW